MRSNLAWCVVILVAVGCGGDDNSPPSIGATASNVCDQIADVACYNLYSCCAQGEINSYLGIDDSESEDACKSDIKKKCERSYADVEASVKAGRAKFNSDAMNSCLKALVAPSGECATVADAIPWTMACMQSAWVGLVSPGGQCFFTYECANAGTQSCSPSQTCVGLPTAGMPCSAGLCAAGNFCNGTTCQAQVGPGIACTTTAQCDTGLFCNTASATPTCAQLLAGGDVCPSSAACMSGVCNPGTCADNGATCIGSSGCTGHCSNSPTLTCSPGFDYECGVGHCSITTVDSCDLSDECPTGETCVLPAMCVPAQCIGSVCSENEVTVDYCTGALSALPGAP